MEMLVWILAALFVLNVVLVFLGGFLLELRRRRQEREVQRLEALWRSPTAAVAVPSRERRGADHPHPEPVWATVERPARSGILRKASFALAVASVLGATVAALIDPGSGDGGSTVAADRGSDGPAVAEGDGSPLRRPPGGAFTDEDGTGGRKSDESPDVDAPGVEAPTGSGAATGAGGSVAVVVAAEATSATAIHLDWADVPAAAGYTVSRSFGRDDGWRTIATTAEGVSAYTDTGLAADTTYFYRVRAVLPKGPAPPSDIVSATTAVAPPDAPVLLSLPETDARTISLSWTDVADETGYRVERMAEGQTGWTTIATTGENVTRYEDGSLVPSRTYSYRVVAIGIGGESAPSNIVRATAKGGGVMDPDGEGPAPSPGPPSDDPTED